jgi:hypothetical protein
LAPDWHRTAREEPGQGGMTAKLRLRQAKQNGMLEHQAGRSRIVLSALADRRHERRIRPSRQLWGSSCRSLWKPLEHGGNRVEQAGRLGAG